MATTPEFKYAPMFQTGEDKTEYYLLTKEGVSTSEFEGKTILKVSKEALTQLTNTAFRDVNFLLRRSHNEQVAKILSDPEASDNDRYVALTFLRNAEVACKGVLPFCQDTGTAIIHGEKGQRVWTDFCDEEALSLGVYKTYTEENLRYSQNAPLNMYDEVNTRCNLPAQIDIEATEGDEYKFLCVVKGGGSANKTYFYQETKAILNKETLVPFLLEKMKTLGTAACPPYHIAFVIGGTSAEKNLLTVKLASTRLSLNGTIIVARDIAHAKLKERLDRGEGLPDYFKNHPVLYAGPAKTPQGLPCGSMGPTTANRMDTYVDLFQQNGGSMVMIAKGNRTQMVTDACKKNGGFYLGSIGGPAAVLSMNSIKSIECVEYPELGMEAVWKIEVENFPAFILVDDKGNDFFKQLPAGTVNCKK